MEVLQSSNNGNEQDLPSSLPLIRVELVKRDDKTIFKNVPSDKHHVHGWTNWHNISRLTLQCVRKKGRVAYHSMCQRKKHLYISKNNISSKSQSHKHIFWFIRMLLCVQVLRWDGYFKFLHFCSCLCTYIWVSEPTHKQVLFPPPSEYLPGLRYTFAKGVPYFMS